MMVTGPPINFFLASKNVVTALIIGHSLIGTTPNGYGALRWKCEAQVHETRRGNTANRVGCGVRLLFVGVGVGEYDISIGRFTFHYPRTRVPGRPPSVQPTRPPTWGGVRFGAQHEAMDTQIPRMVVQRKDLHLYVFAGGLKY